MAEFGYSDDTKSVPYVQYTYSIFVTSHKFINCTVYHGTLLRIFIKVFNIEHLAMIVANIRCRLKLFHY